MKVEVQFPFMDGLTDAHKKLMELCCDAHAVRALETQNASSWAAINGFTASGSMLNGVLSAILATGGPHGPIGDARSVYENWQEEHFRLCLDRGLKVPGFGNSFFKDQMDPAFTPVLEHLNQRFQSACKRLDWLCEQMKKAGKPSIPNAAMFSGIVCSECRWPHGSEPILFLVARAPSWVSLFSQPR